jgi:putative addiction module component (TIGR02574 family)
MLKTDELLSEAISLPIELRVQLVEALLRSLNPTQARIDELWAIEAEKRAAEIETGKVRPLPGDQVFADLRKRRGQ